MLCQANQSDGGQTQIAVLWQLPIDHNTVIAVLMTLAPGNACFNAYELWRVHVMEVASDRHCQQRVGIVCSTYACVALQAFWVRMQFCLQPPCASCSRTSSRAQVSSENGTHTL